MKRIMLLLSISLMPMLVVAQQISREYLAFQQKENIKSLQAQLQTYELDKLSDQSTEGYLYICMELARLTKDTSYLHRVLNVQPVHRQATYLLAVALKDSEPERTIRLLQNLLHQEPSAKEAYHLLGEIYLQQGNKMAYQAQLEKEIHYTTRNLRFYPVKKLAQIYLERNFVDSALQLYQSHLPDLIYTQNLAHLELAKLQLQFYQNYGKVVAHCDTILQRMKKRYGASPSREALHLRGIGYWKQNKIDLAVADWASLQRLGYQLEDQAVDQFYQQLLIDDPEVASYYYVNAIRLQAKAKYAMPHRANHLRQAILYLEKSIQLGLRNHWVYFHLGVCKQLAKDYSGALAAFNQCLLFHPRFAIGFQHRGEVKRSLNLVAESKLDFKRYQALK